MKTLRIPYSSNVKSILSGEEIIRMSVQGYKEGWTEKVLITKYRLNHYTNGEDVLKLVRLMERLAAFSFAMIASLQQTVDFTTNAMSFYEIIKELYDFCTSKRIFFWNNHYKPKLGTSNYSFIDSNGVYHKQVIAKYGYKKSDFLDLSNYFEGLSNSERQTMLKMTRERWMQMDIFDKDNAEQHMALYEQEQKDFMEIQMESELTRKKYLMIGSVAYIVAVVLKLV